MTLKSPPNEVLFMYDLNDMYKKNPDTVSPLLHGIVPLIHHSIDFHSLAERLFSVEALWLAATPPRS